MESMNMTVNNLKIKAVSAFASMKEKVRDFFIHPGYVSGITVIELVLILVKNLALYIEYIEGEKTLKNKLYTRYTQEHGQLILSKKGK